MIELYYWPTPNGHKITIFLEEAGLEYRIHPIDITRGDQFKENFLRIAPNNRIPAIIDTEPFEGTDPLSLFESGAILNYLADKTGLFSPQHGVGRWKTLEWLYWQMGGFGPMLGQNHHFSSYAPEKIPYAIHRYNKEAQRLYGVLNDALLGQDYIAGPYSIADMAIYPWVVSHERQSIHLNDYPAVKSWFNNIQQRPATIKAYKVADEYRNKGRSMEEARDLLFSQGRR